MKIDINKYFRRGFLPLYCEGEGDAGNAGGDAGNEGGGGGGDAGGEAGPFDSFENKEVGDWAKGKGFKGIEEVTTSYKNLEAKIGTKIDPPSDDWGDEQWKGFGEKTRPKSKEAYLLTIPEGMEDKIDKELIESIKDNAFKMGVPAKFLIEPLNAFLQKQADNNKAVEAKANEFIEADNKQLKEDWGEKYDEKSEFSKRGWEAVGKNVGTEEKALQEFLKAIGYDTHPIMKKIGAYIGKLHADATPAGGGDPVVKGDPLNVDNDETIIDYSTVQN